MNNQLIQKLDITNFFDKNTFSLLQKGFLLARKMGLKEFNEYVLLNLLLEDFKIKALLGNEEGISKLLQNASETIKRQIPDPRHEKAVFMSTELQKILIAAFQEVRQQKKKSLTIEDILLAFAKHPEFSKLFEKVGIDAYSLAQKIEGEGGIFAKKLERFTPILDKYTKDFSDLAYRGAYNIVGRQQEQSQITRILARQTRNNVLLIGERGVGKKAIVQGLAKKIVDGDVPMPLKSVQILELNLPSLQSAAHSRERLEVLIEGLRNEMRENQNILLLIENFDSLFNFEKSRELFEIGNLLRPSIINEEVRIIGTLNSESYRKYIEIDAVLQKAFDIVKVDEPNEEDAVEIVNVAAQELAGFHGVEISNDAVKASVYLSKRYLPEKFLPEKALDLLDEACSKVSLEKEKTVSDDDINQIISEKTGIPVQKITESEQAKLINLEKILAESVIGQDHAVKIVSESIRRARAGLKDPKKPIGSFLFLGPTGVGKTELGKVLTKVVYDDESAMIRLDMSEFSESHTVQRLVGAPPGYVGYEEGGQLTNPIWERPYSLILLDEIEKANPKVFDIFLQVLDDGRLTDGKGRTVDFKNTIIIATSNIASAEISDLMKDKEKEVDAREVLMPVLMDYFRPEFINRFDAVIAFSPLSLEVMKVIARINIDKMVRKLLEKGISLTYSQSSIEKIAKESFDPKMGARPLLRYIHQNVENVIAKEIIQKGAEIGRQINLDDLLTKNGGSAETA